MVIQVSFPFLNFVCIMKKTLLTIALTLSITGCSTYLAPTPVDSSDVCWKDVPVKVHSQNDTNLIEYRTCKDAKTKGGNPEKIEAWLERVAQKFCARQGAHYKLLQERRGYPNFDHTARVELIFACTRDISDATIVSRNGLKQNAKMQKQQYELLLQLQQLHQAGALTDEEFQKEKKRILEY